MLISQVGDHAMYNRKKKNKPKLPKKLLPGYKEYLTQKLEIDESDELPLDTRETDSKLLKIFKDAADFKSRHLHLPSKQDVSLYFFSGLIDQDQIHKGIINPLIKRIEENITEKIYRVQDVLYSIHIEEVKSWKELIQECLNGKIICHIDQLMPISISVTNVEQRSPSDPTTEYQVLGPKMGFIENSRSNVAIVRRFLIDPRLKVQEFKLGSVSHTHTAVLYLDEYVDPDLVDLVIERLQQIEEDNIVSSGQLEKLIVDYPMSIFPQVLKTERPDNVSYALSQGKVVIILDNTTFALILPINHLDLYNTSEDNFQSVFHKALIRAIRMLSLIVATIFPALYVAMVAFHPELIPSTLALTIADTRNNIPFPAATEAFIMIIALDILVESSIRLPMFVGQTIGIVGGLVIGQAAVEAGVISSTMIIVVASTAIASFTAPSWDLVSAVRIVRYILLAFATVFGLFGVTLALFAIIIHLSHLTSFSKPYLSPVSPLNLRELFGIFFKQIPRK